MSILKIQIRKENREIGSCLSQVESIPASEYAYAAFTGMIPQLTLKVPDPLLNKHLGSLP